MRHDVRIWLARVGQAIRADAGTYAMADPYRMRCFGPPPTDSADRISGLYYQPYSWLCAAGIDPSFMISVLTVETNAKNTKGNKGNKKQTNKKPLDAKVFWGPLPRAKHSSLSLRVDFEFSLSLFSTTLGRKRVRRNCALTAKSANGCPAKKETRTRVHKQHAENRKTVSRTRRRFFKTSTKKKCPSATSASLKKKKNPSSPTPRERKTVSTPNTFIFGGGEVGVLRKKRRNNKNLKKKFLQSVFLATNQKYAHIHWDFLIF